MRIPDGTATVCVEVMCVTKVGHWGDPLRRLAHDPGSVSQETCSADLTAVAPGLGADGSAFVKSDGVALCCSVLFVCRRSPFAAWNTAKRTIFAGSSDTAFHPRRKLPAGGKKHFGKKSLVKAAEKYRTAPRNSAKKSQTGFLPQFKVWKTKESCMYLRLSKKGFALF